MRSPFFWLKLATIQPKLGVTGLIMQAIASPQAFKTALVQVGAASVGILFSDTRLFLPAVSSGLWRWERQLA